MAVAPVSQDQFVLGKMEAAEFFSARVVRQFIMIAHQFRQANAVMDTPIGTGAARFLNIRGVDGAHPIFAGPDAPSQAPLLFGQ